jgi:hypothetical protein
LDKVGEACECVDQNCFLRKQFLVAVANVVDVAGIIKIITYDGNDCDVLLDTPPIPLTLIYRKAIKKGNNDLLNEAIDLSITDPGNKTIPKVNGATKVQLVRGGGLVAHRLMENGKR